MSEAEKEKLPREVGEANTMKQSPRISVRIATPAINPAGEIRASWFHGRSEVSYEDTLETH